MEMNLKAALNQRDLLFDALEDVLVVDCVIAKGSAPTGPELLLAASEYIESKNRKE